MSAGDTERPPRTAAEWVTFATACLVLAAIVALVASEMAGPDEPPAPVASSTGEVREVGGRFFVPVEVVNTGDATAANVQVTAELTVGSATSSGDQTIDFLGGDERVEVVFAFDDDPAGGELSVRVSGYSVP
jgi:uncharacterized protein (TIGR02588 family)